MDILESLPTWALPLTIGLFLLVNLIVGLYQGKHLHSLKSYALADKKMSTGTLSITIIATLVGARYVTSRITSTQEKGIFSGLVGLIITPLLIILLARYIFPRLLKLKDCHTLGDVMGRLYGKYAQVFTGIFSVVVSMLLLAAQLIAIGSICEKLKINKTMILILMGLTLTVYTSLGGIRSVAATDIFQFVCVTLGFVFIVYRILQLDGGDGKAIGSVQHLFQLVEKNHGNKYFVFWSHPRFWGLISGYVSSLAIVFAAPIINRVLVARDVKQMQRSFYGFSLFFILIRFLLIIIGLGLLLKQGPGKIKENTSFYTLVKVFFGGNPWAIILLLTMLLAVVMSTADSFLNSAVVVVLQDIIKPLRKEKKELNLKKMIPLLAFILGGIAIITTLLFQNHSVATLVEFATRGLGIFFVPLLFYALHLKTNPKIFWTSTISFFLVGILLGWLALHDYLYVDHFSNWGHLKSRRKLTIVLPFTLLCTFIISLVVHLIIHKGWGRLPKKEGTIKAWKIGEEFTSLRAFFKSPRLWASDKIVCYGSLPVLLGMFLSFSWMVPELTAPQPHSKNLNVLFWIRFIGFSLCVGLLLHTRWSQRAKAYFPLYYYFTLGYGLPFSYTISFLYNPNNSVNTIFWFVAIMLLVFLVDRQTFLILVVGGISLGCFVAYLSPVHEAIAPQAKWDATISILYAILLKFLFSRVKEEAVRAQAHTQKLWASGYLHDIDTYISETNLATESVILQLKANVKEVTKNGEKYCALMLPKKEYDDRFTSTMEMHKVGYEKLRQQLRALGSLVHQGEVSAEHMKRDHAQKHLKVAMTLLPTSYAKAIAIKVNPSHDFAATLHTTLLGNIITNLIKNAAKHGNATAIEIGCESKKREIYIKDNGKGIPPAIQTHIFDLYYTTGGATSTGVGLPFVRKLMELMGGYIRFESTPLGTTFFIGFP